MEKQVTFLNTPAIKLQCGPGCMPDKARIRSAEKKCKFRKEGSRKLGKRTQEISAPLTAVIRKELPSSALIR